MWVTDRGHMEAPWERELRDSIHSLARKEARRHFSHSSPCLPPEKWDEKLCHHTQLLICSLETLALTGHISSS